MKNSGLSQANTWAGIELLLSQAASAAIGITEAANKKGVTYAPKGQDEMAVVDRHTELLHPL